jgi:hypothetical protein
MILYLKTTMRLSILGLILSVSSIGFAQCPVGDVVLNSMDELNQFYTDYPDCTRLDGSMTVTGEDVWSLLPLASLDTIMGNFELTALGFLNNFSGLSNLKYVHGDFLIQNNAFLSNVSGLQGIFEIGAQLIISNNPSLVSLNGLNNLDETGGLKLLSLPSLSQVNALAQLDSIHGDFQIIAAASLNNITGLAALKQVDGHMSIQNTAIANLASLDGLNTVGGFLNLNNNPNLVTLGLNGLETIGGDLRIKNHSQLLNIDGLASLGLIQGDFQLISNSLLENMLSMDQSVSISDSVVIVNNPFLSTCNVLSICNHFEGSTAGLIDGNANPCTNVKMVIDSCLPSSIEEVDASYFNVYPNPFTIAFSIQSQSPIDHWELYDMRGVLAASNGNEHGNSLDLSQLSKGTYMIRIVQAERSVVQLLIKE